LTDWSQSDALTTPLSKACPAEPESPTRGWHDNRTVEALSLTGRLEPVSEPATTPYGPNWPTG
jgi:hypothetical protein